MKKYLNFVIPIIIFVLGYTDVFAQLKVKGSYGKVVIGKDIESPIEDTHGVLVGSIFGNPDLLEDFNSKYYRAGAKLSFGDFGRYERWGWNVFVGEYGKTDTDKLWLHGKNGFKITFGRGDECCDNIMDYDVSSPYKLYVNMEIYTKGNKIDATPNNMSNISDIKNSYDRIRQIKGIAYDYIPYKESVSNPYTDLYTIDSTVGISAKEENDKTFFTNFREKQVSYTMVKNGFDVVQLSKVFPELVSENTDGSVYIDYLGLIPVLVNVINEQSEILEAMGMKVREISEMNSVYIEEDSILLLNKVSKQNNSVETKAFLYQNTPNPFSNLTEIKYFIPNSANNAYIYIFNMQGDMLYSECLENKGYSSITIDAFSLNAGIYLYSLYVDGIEIATKKMVLTK